MRLLVNGEENIYIKVTIMDQKGQKIPTSSPYLNFNILLIND